MSRTPRVVLVGDSPVNRRQTIMIMTAMLDRSQAVDFLVPVAGLADSQIPPIAQVIGSYIMGLTDEVEYKMIFVYPAGEDVPDDGMISDLRERASVVESKEDTSPLATSLHYARPDKGDVVAVVWDDEDPSVASALEGALAKGLPVHDLTNDFRKIDSVEQPAEATAEAETPAEEPQEAPESPGITEADILRQSLADPALAAAHAAYLKAVTEVVVGAALAILIQRSAA